ncbi:hypothetical protein SAMN05216354_2770 [Xylanibacter ruminicola]|jgi:hypothetical protein|uniref:Uncharacterized protein n=1 Tax=Xylanibacter ruminicola TaxID=839 RepID=A0A1H5XEU1_XYLRU|nr:MULTISPECIES: hypothetical protein [Prevotellaceae]MCR5470371.1 hypothetical protein [Prevotella sp.]SEG10163.1 hypothetical protein SAMN05216354_2770 [Xylanibacter ruminicola]SEW02754.1 hypothetical protein SAMN04487827_1336 [Prevotella sp. khp7]
MAKKTKWQDDYWLLLMQIYLQKPVGIKPMYSRKMIDLSLELHVSPSVLFNKMCQIANLETPRIEHIWEVYGSNPRKLARAASLLREMKGFNNAGLFYEGVETNESFELDFKPVAEGETLTPVMLTLILDLYFRLTPITMVIETPEVQELAKLLKQKPQRVVEVLEVFQYCDPYLNRKDVTFDPLLLPCQQVWRRYGNANTEDLASYAEQLKEYFK